MPKIPCKYPCCTDIQGQIFFSYLCRLYTYIHTQRNVHMCGPTSNRGQSPPSRKCNFLEVQLNDHLSCLYSNQLGIKWIIFSTVSTFEKRLILKPKASLK